MAQNGTVKARELEIEEMIQKKQEWLTEAYTRLENATDIYGIRSKEVHRLSDEITWAEFELELYRKLI